MPEIVLVQGDITAQEVDAVVNAANSSLMGGGGVDGAIHRRGGPEILQECKRIRAERFPDGLPTGHAVATTGGQLPARWVIHTVGPVYSGSEDRSDLLASCHTEALRVADELDAEAVAFPAISTASTGIRWTRPRRWRSGRSGGPTHGSGRSGSFCSTTAPSGRSSERWPIPDHGEGAEANPTSLLEFGA